MKLNDLAIGSYFRSNDRLYLVVEHHCNLVETIEFLPSGLFIRKTFVGGDKDVESVGTNFYQVITYYQNKQS